MSRATRQDDQRVRSSRRGMLKQTAGAAVAGAAVATMGIKAPASGQEPSSAERAVKNGRIKQSIVYWCFEKHWDMPQTIKVAKQLGCVSIELVAPKFFPLLKQEGLSCAIGSIDIEPKHFGTAGLVHDNRTHDQTVHRSQRSRQRTDASQTVCLLRARGVSPPGRFHALIEWAEPSLAGALDRNRDGR